ncbi:B3 domain-containing protein, partial [Mucuna pruriens]
MRDLSFHPKCFTLVQANNRERWQMDYHHPNQFFIIIKNTKLLKVPETFLKHLNEDVSGNIAVLIGPSGDQWQVTILKKGNDMYMQNGWPQFLSDNSVMLDEFLLFTYHGGNCFHVQIFCKNGCERPCLIETSQEQAATPSLARTKKSTQRKTFAGSFLHESKKFCQEDLPFSNKGSFSNGRETKKTRQKQASATPSLARTNKSKQRKTCAGSFHLHESKSCQEDLPFINIGSLSNTKKARQKQAATPSLVRTNKSKQRKTYAGSSHIHESTSCQEDLLFSNKGSLSKDFPQPQISIKIESSEAIKLAESFTSRNPHWTHLMTKSNVEDRCILHIATEFARKHIPEAVKEIVLWNSEGKFWEVTVNCFELQSKRYTQFTNGWGRFVRDNKLMRGDTCIFELEDGNHVSVHIFRTR